MTPFFLVYFRSSRNGREHGRVKGGLIVAANHRSFLDPFVIGGALPWRRPMNYVAKVELFERRWQGWLLSRLGAFPIRRGESDEESMETARMVVERGGTVCIFPEGTRIRTGSLGHPEARRRPPRPADRRPGDPGRRARHRGRAPRLADPPPQGQGPARQGDDLPARRGALAGAGGDGDRPDLAQRRAAVGGPRRPAADAPRRGDRRRQLGHRGRGAARPRRARRPARHPHRRAGGRARRRPRERALPARRRAARLAARPPGGQDRARRPRPRLPRDPLQLAAAGGRRDRRPGRRPDRGPAAHQGPGRAARTAARPSTSASGCAPARSPASAARRTPARRSPARPRWCSAPPTPTCAASSARSSTAPASSASAPATSTGVEMAGAAKNAAALAAAAAEPHGLNAAGIAAAEVWRECTDYAIERGAELETFSGLAGVGDLTATMMAPTGRNRRAGELLGAGHPGGGDPADHRPGLRGPRRRAAARRGDRRGGLPGRGARRPDGADPRRDRRRRLDRRPAPGRALAEGGMSVRR